MYKNGPANKKLTQLKATLENPTQSRAGLTEIEPSTVDKRFRVERQSHILSLLSDIYLDYMPELIIAFFPYNFRLLPTTMLSFMPTTLSHFILEKTFQTLLHDSFVRRRKNQHRKTQEYRVKKGVLRIRPVSSRSCTPDPLKQCKNRGQRV